MRTHVIRGALVLVAVLIVSAPTFAQSIVFGSVTDGQGQPIEGATVAITHLTLAVVTEIITDESGEYFQVGLSSGAYEVTATKDALSQTYPTNVRQDTRSEVNFILSAATAAGFATADEAEAAALEKMRGMVEEAVDAMNAGQDDEAIKLFNQIVFEAPTCTECFVSLGAAYARQQQYTEAETAYQRAIELRPDSSDAVAGLVNVYNAQKKFDLAAEASQKLAELSASAGTGSSSEDMYNQGVVLWNAGNFAEAKAQFEAVLKVDPNMALAHYQLAMASLNLGQLPEARAAFEGYLKVDPNGEKAAEVETFLGQLPQ